MRARSSITIRYIPAPVPGPVFYPAGVWSALGMYERTSSACPFVLYDTGNPATDLYYYLSREVKIVGSASNKTPAADYAASGASATWKPLENIGYVFANLIMANFGLIAGAVFSDNKLMSQYGVDDNGDFSSDYQKYGKGFTPNILIDWMRGQIIGGKDKYMLLSDGSVSIQGGFQRPSHRVSVVGAGEHVLSIDKYCNFNIVSYSTSTVVLESNDWDKDGSQVRLVLMTGSKASISVKIRLGNGGLMDLPSGMVHLESGATNCYNVMCIDLQYELLISYWYYSGWFETSRKKFSINVGRATDFSV